jgi:hypothetical protein
MNKSYVTCAAVAIALASTTAADLQINVRTSGAQANPAVAADPAGGSLIVWSSYFTTAGRSNDILARRLDPRGGFVGGEFQVNAGSEGNQTEPAVAMDRRGKSAVVWQGPGSDQEGIFLRLFDGGGIPLTEDMPVNRSTTGRQLYPNVALSDSGVLVVVWETRMAAQESDRIYACAQLFDPNGIRLGEEIIVDDTLYDGRYPDVGIDRSGNFTVTWLRETGGNRIMARRFDPNGVPATDPFEVSTARIASVTGPSIGMNARGHFVIAWDGDPNRAGDDDVHARRYDPNGTPGGEPFVVNTLRGGAQQWPQVAINDANAFLVVWQHDTQDPNLGTEIHARRFDPNGEPAGAELALNTHTLDRQRYPDVALAPNGTFIAVWESNNQDGSGYGIFARLEPGPAIKDNEP